MDEPGVSVADDIGSFKELFDEKAELNKEALEILEKHGLTILDIDNKAKLQGVEVSDMKRIKEIRSRLKEIKGQHQDISNKLSTGSQ